MPALRETERKWWVQVDFGSQDFEGAWPPVSLSGGVLPAATTAMPSQVSNDAQHAECANDKPTAEAGD